MKLARDDDPFMNVWEARWNTLLVRAARSGRRFCMAEEAAAIVSADERVTRAQQRVMTRACKSLGDEILWGIEYTWPDGPTTRLFYCIGRRGHRSIQRAMTHATDEEKAFVDNALTSESAELLERRDALRAGYAAQRRAKELRAG